MLHLDPSTVTPTANKAFKEFQAVVMCGGGSELFPLSEGRLEHLLPKALLPVANKPMIAYQLQWIEDAGIHDVIIICDEASYQKISNYVHKVYEKSVECKIEVVKVKDIEETAYALKHIANRIKLDFIVMSCDIITNFPPQKLLDIHRIQNPSVTALFYENMKSEEAGAKKDDDSMEFVGYPVVNIHTKIKDAHVYVFKRWVIDFISKAKLGSIKDEVLPLLIHCQYSDHVLKREGIDKLISAPQNSDPFMLAREMSTTGGGFAGVMSTPQVVITATVAKEGYCFRANTTWAYLEGNRQMPKNPTDKPLILSKDIGQKAQIGLDSMVGEDTKIGERSSVKKSIIGNHCVIGKNVKIAGSVIMDHCVIEDNVKLDSTIVCNGARIQESAQLKDCQVAAGCIVEKDDQMWAPPYNQQQPQYGNMPFPPPVMASGFVASAPPQLIQIPPQHQQQQQQLLQPPRQTYSAAPTPSTLDMMDPNAEIPYPEGYVPPVKSSTEKEKEKGKKKSSSSANANAAGSSSSFGVNPGPSSYKPPTYTVPVKEEKKKKKKILRAAGGEVWEDPTLQEWDSNDFRIFCGDLGNEVTDELLQRAFSKYPSAVKARVVRDKRTSKTKGYGFVSFKDPNDFVKALREMDGKYVGNRPIKLRKSTWDDRNVESKHLRKTIGGAVLKK
ncbi:hypothetical protein HDU76_000788 [Blyttiomyces sp. JEL0837]|nr:hypothetical protein HDU76_000788 [Blyttiomyces sp. JEL0837]